MKPLRAFNNKMIVLVNNMMFSISENRSLCKTLSIYVIYRTLHETGPWWSITNELDPKKS